MPKFFATDLKYAAAGTDLSTVTAQKLADEGASVKIEPNELEIKGSESANPVDVFENGKKIEVKTVLVADTLADLQAALNGDA